MVGQASGTDAVVQGAEESAGRAVLWRRVVRFWCDDLPPLDGRLRLIFYVLLLLTAWTFNSSAFTVVDLSQRVDMSIYRLPAGLLRTLGATVLPPYAVLYGLRVVMIVCWLLAALGLLWRFTAPLTALLFAVLYGFSVGIGNTHKGHVALWVLCSLCFCRPQDRWTLDTLIGRRFPGFGRLAGTAGPLTASGFGRKVALLGAVAILFGAGVAKLRLGGLAWLDGQPIHLAISWTPVVMGRYRVPAVAAFMLEHRWACQLAAYVTIVLEVGAITALFSRRLRYLVLLSGCFLHLGILMVMFPAFWLHMICYLPCIDWNDVWQRLRSRQRVTKPPLPAGPEPLARLRAAVFGCSLAALWAVVLIAKVEYWPLSYSPLYAEYITRENLAAMRDPQVRRQTAQASVGFPSYYFLRGAMTFVCPLRVVDDRTGHSHYVRPRLSTGSWEGFIGDLIVQDLALPEHAPSQGPVSQFLRSHLDLIVPASAALVSPVPQLLPADIPRDLHPDRIEIACAFERIARNFPDDAPALVVGEAPLGPRERALLKRQ